MKGKCCTNKELRQVGCGSGPGKTKPIRSGGGYQGQGSAACAPAPEFRASCTNKPKFRPGPCEGQVLYGQRVMVDYTCRGLRQNKANSVRGRAILPTARPSGLWPPSVVQTNPIPALMPIRRSAFPEGETCKTNPISAVAAVESPITPAFHHSSIPIPCRSCDIASMPRFGQQSRFPGVEPRQWMWNPPRYSGRTQSVPRRPAAVDRAGGRPYDSGC
jgi:hypothetical protein